LTTTFEIDSMNYKILYPILKTEIIEASPMISHTKSHYTPLQTVLLLNLLNHGATLQVLYLLALVRMPKTEETAVTNRMIKNAHF
jgi:hypothetical protein